MKRHLTLVNEEGREEKFILIDIIELAEDRYAILLPADEKEALILKMQDKNTFIGIEDEEEYEVVKKLYNKRKIEEEDIEI